MTFEPPSRLPPLPPKRTCLFRQFRTFNQYQAGRESSSPACNLLEDLGHDVHTLHDERLIGHVDREIWEAAQKESRFLITQELDFSDHDGLLLVPTTASCSYAFTREPRNLIERIGVLFGKEGVGE